MDSPKETDSDRAQARITVTPSEVVISEKEWTDGSITTRVAFLTSAGDYVFSFGGSDFVPFAVGVMEHLGKYFRKQAARETDRNAK